MAAYIPATQSWLGQAIGLTPAATAYNTWWAWNTQYYLTAASTQTVWVSWNANYRAPFRVEHMPRSNAECEADVKSVEEARQCARALLLESLTPEQRESYEEHGLFVVETPKKNRYRLHRSQNPRKLSGNKEVVTYCIHTYGVPRDDELLGFKLLLEANEEEFLKIANATPVAA